MTNIKTMHTCKLTAKDVQKDERKHICKTSTNNNRGLQRKIHFNITVVLKLPRLSKENVKYPQYVATILM